MKVTLIHGDDLERSRARYGSILDAIKKRGWSLVRLSGNEAETIPEKLVGNSLFQEDILFIMDKANDLTVQDLKWFSENHELLKDINLLLWYKGDAPKRLTDSMPKNANIEHFPFPKLLFTFLDAMFPGNTKTCLTLLHQLLENEPVELVFAMIARRFRDLYWVSADQNSMGGPKWLVGKLVSQARKFDQKKLRYIINDLADLDIKSKTEDISLQQSLDLLILKHLE